MDEPPDHALGVSHGGFGSKLHLATEAGGMPIGSVLTAGFRNECPTFPRLVESVRRWRRKLPEKLAADKGYSADAIRIWLRQRHVEAVIPMRHNEHVQDRPTFNREAYRGRNVVERCVCRLKNFRRIATRYEKLAGNFAGMVTIAMIILYLRLPL